MHNPAKILIVDDASSIYEILGYILAEPREDGTTPLVFYACNGQAAFEVLKEHQDIDVIVLDLNMPVMNGFEFLTQIKDNHRFRAIPVCVFSGSAGDSIKALQHGACDFINKPGDFQEISIRVFNHIENKRKIEANERARIHFLASVSHELLTPMNGVVGAIQLLQLTLLTTEQCEYIEILEESSESMMTMINNVIRFLESENPFHHLPHIPFSLRETVRQLIDSLAGEANNNDVTLLVDIDTDLPDNLIGLPDKISLIFSYLLSNAIKFSPSGNASLCIKPGALDKTSVLLHCQITDTGIGIPPELQASIFEPFSQVDCSFTRKFGGLGIGLSIARSMVRMMGGSLHVESAPGCGSTFDFAVSCAIDAEDVVTKGY